MAREGYPLDWMTELKSKNDIVSVVSRYVRLDYKGGRYWGCCPFHHEKTPSFTVNQREGFYYCFGCHAGGDVVKFVQEMENVGFPEAIKLLADAAGMQVPETEQSEALQTEKKYRDRLYAALKEAAGHYYRNLADPVIGKKVREYLAKRKIPTDVVVRFGLGYSKDFNSVIDYLREKGFSDKEILDSGVGTKNKNGSLYDALADRLIVPIINRADKVVAFGGRILEKKDGVAKYRNTTNTPVFEKNKTLFGINIAKKQRQKAGITEVIIVEGYMDVISLNKVGIANAVAGMGTALCDGQARELKYLSDRVYVCYDGDGAGQNAAAKSLEVLEKAGLEIFVITLTGGMDPDDVANKLGQKGFFDLMEKALPLTDYKLKLVEDRCNMATANGRAKYATGAMEVLRGLSNPTERDVYVGVVSEKSRIPDEQLRKYFSGELKLTADDDSEPSKPLKAPENDETKEDKPSAPYLNSAEYVLKCLLYAKPFAKLQDVAEEFLTYAPHKEVYAYLKMTDENGKTPSPGMLFDFMDSTDEVLGIIQGDFGVQDEQSQKKVYTDCVRKLKKEYYNKIIKDLLTVYSSADDEKKAEIAEKIKEYQILMRKN